MVTSPVLECVSRRTQELAVSLHWFPDLWGEAYYSSKGQLETTQIASTLENSKPKAVKWRGFWSRKHRESAYLHSNCTGRIWYSFWNSGEGLGRNLRLILVNFSSSYSSHPSLNPSHLSILHNLWELGWAKRTMSSKYWGSLLWLLIAAFDHRSAKRWASILTVPSPIVASPSCSRWSDFQVS